MSVPLGVMREKANSGFAVAITEMISNGIKCFRNVSRIAEVLQGLANGGNAVKHIRGHACLSHGSDAQSLS